MRCWRRSCHSKMHEKLAPFPCMKHSKSRLSYSGNMAVINWISRNLNTALHSLQLRLKCFFWDALLKQNNQRQDGPMFATLISQATQAFCIAFLIITLPLSPIGIALLAGPSRGRRYLRHYVDTVRRTARMTQQMLKADVVARRMLIKLSRYKSASLERVVGECTHCGNCCINKSCVYLEFDHNLHSRCAVYNNWFWKMTRCADYPINALEIALYSCPSYSTAASAGIITEQPVKIITMHAMARARLECAKPVQQKEV